MISIIVDFILEAMEYKLIIEIDRLFIQSFLTLLYLNDNRSAVKTCQNPGSCMALTILRRDLCYFT